VNCTRNMLVSLCPVKHRLLANHALIIARSAVARRGWIFRIRARPGYLSTEDSANELLHQESAAKRRKDAEESQRLERVGRSQGMDWLERKRALREQRNWCLCCFDPKRKVENLYLSGNFGHGSKSARVEKFLPLASRSVHTHDLKARLELCWPKRRALLKRSDWRPIQIAEARATGAGRLWGEL